MSVDEPEVLSDKATSNSLPFPPLTKSHILHCSYHFWHPKYRAITPKARLVPLTREFVTYLKADGIVLPPEENEQVHWDSDSGVFSGDNGSDTVSDGDDESLDPSAQWPAVHQSIRDTIQSLGGKVVPKLNWSAPKDATWINPTNNMECRTPNDIYLMLKSSDFIMHDLEHAFDGCMDFTGADSSALDTIPYHLVLRKHLFMNPSVEFRCFVRNKKLLGMCQRDLNYYDFLLKMKDDLASQIQLFFDMRLRDTFPDSDFVFDVYIPAPYDRVWLVDINPWAIRTDPLLFSWLELLTMPDPATASLAEAMGEGFVRLEIGKVNGDARPSSPVQSSVDEDEEDDDSDVEEYLGPELRLIYKDDPEAYNFSTPQYSAHKLPKDVVDASQLGMANMKNFADQWRDAMARHERGELHQDTSSDDGDD